VSAPLGARAVEVLRALVLGAPLYRSEDGWHFYGFDGFPKGGVPDPEVMEFLLLGNYLARVEKNRRCVGEITEAGRDFLREASKVMRTTEFPCVDLSGLSGMQFPHA
jgi:hypothetical protein